ncbi:uncharacterized protein LOC113230047 [Hyposmocoma kahamanoa]|uniref:uncharacterized protein LOC113230047 n=1 Tax=Hyposmocoma kahamanoa TaxID=1477025 RepID=UPI000E6D90DE|nr:uncharacterized protein LOC113230047 [Hyposmocoma kahamanoa]
MVLLAPSVSALRKLLNIRESYAESHGLAYNVKKTVYMVFKAGNKCPTKVGLVPPVLLNGVTLKRVFQFKYLGHLVTEDLRDDADMERERRALSVRANMLVRRFARCTDTVKITLFKAFCTSLYTLPRFCSASSMFADARVDDFDAVWRKKTASLLNRMRGSCNGILKAIAHRPDCPMMYTRTEANFIVSY